jgi:3-oxoacyl-[acyl-carrier-protein] synthase II
MAEQQRRVVVTGMGAITPVGLDVASTWDGLVHGRSGIAKATLFDCSDLEVKIAGEVKGFDPHEHFDRKEARRMDRYLHLGLVASREAVCDARLEVAAEESEQVGVVMGSGCGGISTVVEQTAVLLARGPERVSPFAIPMFLANMLSGLVCMRVGAKGPSFNSSSACATSGHCLGEAMEIIKRGDAEVMIAGGSEAPLTRIGIASFDAMRALSRRNDQPERASRPFDRDRDGFVMAEAAGALVLETLEHARNPDAPQ